MWQMRLFQPSDQPIVKRLIQTGLAQRFGTLDESLNPDINDIQTSYVEADAVFLVVEQGSEIIGCGALIHENGSDEVARIVRVSVRQDQQRKGLGGAISTELLNRAQQKGYQQVLVETNCGWHSAIQLYQSLGFEEYRRDYVAEFDFTEVHMALKLPRTTQIRSE